MGSHRFLWLMTVVLVLASACTADNDKAASDHSLTPTTFTAPVSDCPVAHRIPLDIHAQSPAELEYLDKITACTNIFSTQVWLQNRSDAVWQLHATNGADVDQLTNSPRIKIFRTHAASVHDWAVLAPHTNVVVHAPPEEVQWTIHRDLSGMWLLNHSLLDLIESKGQEQIAGLVGTATLRGKALYTCSLAAYNWTNTPADVLASDNPSEQLLDALNTAASTATCKADWETANTAASKKGQSAATWSDDVVHLNKTAKLWSNADDYLHWVYTASKILTRR